MDALTVELNGAPGMIRTCDPLIRSQVLYPTELRVRLKRNLNIRVGFWSVKRATFRSD
jgi:hypothetical protein